MTRVAAPLVYITGASSGIGLALAQRYHRAGWRLALLARRTEGLQAWRDELGATTEFDFGVYRADVRDLAALSGAASHCMAVQGLPDVVIANAGMSVGVDLGDADDLEVMRETLETNLLGLVATFQPFVRPMCERGTPSPSAGRPALVGVASMTGIRGLPGHAAYCASKAGVIAACESLRGELRPLGVDVVTLVPGYVATPLTRRNRYAMPFLMTAEAFADKAFAAIAARASYRVIPWQMGWVARLLRVLPDALLDRLLAGQPRKRRRGESD